MYLDAEYRRILPTLPNAYKYTSNFDCLSDEELKLFRVYKIESFVEDEMYIAFTQILGTKYFPSAKIDVEFDDSNPGAQVKVVLDVPAVIAEINADKGQSGQYANINDCILGIETVVHDSVQVAAPEFEYDDSSSYVFICLGNSSLDLLANNDGAVPNSNVVFKYSLKRSLLSALPKISVGQKVSQASGFSGVVEFVDSDLQIIKINSCVGIDQIDRLKDLSIGSNKIAASDLFSYELYRKVKSFGGNPWTPPSNYNNDLAQKSIYISTFFVSPDITENGSVVGDDELHMVRNDQYGMSAESRERFLNSYGRLM